MALYMLGGDNMKGGCVGDDTVPAGFLVHNRQWPYDTGYSTGSEFAALKVDGSITYWGDERYESSGAPTDDGYVPDSLVTYTFAAL